VTIPGDSTRSEYAILIGHNRPHKTAALSAGGAGITAMIFLSAKVMLQSNSQFLDDLVVTRTGSEAVEPYATVD
jgi:hypothetical protein